MFKRLVRGLTYTVVLLNAGFQPAQRRLLARMITFSRTLPQQFEQPLPMMMAQLTPVQSTVSSLAAAALPTPDQTRKLADAVATWHIRSPLGICLRRSLLRYHFLREIGLPVQIIFGARLKGNQADEGLGGHAWLTLHDSPYFEAPTDIEGFVEMYHYPPQTVASYPAAGLGQS